MQLIQLEHSRYGRRVGIIEDKKIILLEKSITSSYNLFKEIINGSNTMLQTLEMVKTKEVIDYDGVYFGNDKWHLLPPIDCVDDPMRCMLSGTGLTHKASAENRQKMHESQQADQMTDSMKMYMIGEEGGKPGAGTVGAQPEWFFKGNGNNLRGPGQPLVVPNYANDGGEEPEIAGIYIISEAAIPYRIGFTQANEFSDHVMEKKNYLYLAPSKIRNCSIGPELIVTDDFNELPGTVQILRDGKVYWSKSIRSGENVMAHSLANLEYHHFKYASHRIPGQLHIHFFGAGAFSFGEQIALKQGDIMSVSFENMGRPLVNPLQIDSSQEHLFEIRTLQS